MYITVDRSPVKFKEFITNAVLWGLVTFGGYAAIDTVLFGKAPLAVLAINGFSFIGFATSCLCIWLRCAKEGCLDFEGKWQVQGKKLIQAGMVGFGVGVLLSKHVMALGVGTIFAGAFVFLALMPYRKQKWLNTHKMKEWSDTELKICLETVKSKDSKENRLLSQFIQEEMESRSRCTALQTFE